MESIQAKLQQVQLQEQELQFPYFTSQIALQLGLLIITKAQEKEKAIAVEITKNNQKLFYHAMDGTSPDQEYWIRRKSNVVKRHFHSSYFMRLYNESKQRSYYSANAVSEEEYAVHGGSFPLSVRGTGVVGTITVSGLSQEEDHQLVVDAITKILQENK